MSDNLALWKAVEKTPENQTKKITGKSYNGNSPKPHYLVWKATETFGPVGIGWGFDVVSEEVVDGATYADGSRERLHKARVRVWYVWNDKRGEVEHIGGTIFSGRRKAGDGAPFTDEDAPKKSVTDALIKALSMIGFAGDIFMGRYDDSKYIAELREEARQENAAPAEPQPDLLDQWTNDVCARLSRQPDKTKLTAAWKWVEGTQQYSDICAQRRDLHDALIAAKTVAETNLERKAA